MPNISVYETAFPVRKFEDEKMKFAVFSSLVGFGFDRDDQLDGQMPLLAQRDL